MIAFLDIETGGFSIDKNGICEIAAIAVCENTLKIQNQFHKLIKPYTRADDTDQLVSYKPDSMGINGITEQQLIDEGQDVTEVCEALYQFIIKNDITVIIGHCSKTFDIPRIAYLFNRFLGVNIHVLIEQEDTNEIAKKKLTLPNYKLQTVCEHFGVINAKEHSAMDDTVATYEVYKHLIKL